MPNWVTSRTVIEGPAEVIADLRKQVSTPYTSPWDADQTVSGPFLLWNIIRPLDMVAYLGQPAKVANNPVDNLEAWREEIQQEMRVGMDWWNWNVRNWGTKWETTSAGVMEDETTDTKLVVYYDTAWSPPAAALEILSRQYPDAVITSLFRDENDCFAGRVQFAKGELVLDEDVSIDHALMIELYGECWVCQGEIYDPEECAQFAEDYHCADYLTMDIPDTPEGLV